MKKYFNEPGSDLLAYVPKDFNASPSDFLSNVENPQARKWALQVHELWLELSRQVAPSVEKEPDSHTLLPLIQPVVVPGARFREVYYWDSYWVIKYVIIYVSLCFLFHFWIFLVDCFLLIALYRVCNSKKMLPCWIW